MLYWKKINGKNKNWAVELRQQKNNRAARKKGCPVALPSVRGLKPAVCSFAVPMVAALPLATADCGVLFYSLYHPQDALATSPITRSESPHS